MGGTKKKIVKVHVHVKIISSKWVNMALEINYMYIGNIVLILIIHVYVAKELFFDIFYLYVHIGF